MKSINQVLWILALWTSCLFFSKNANAQCSSFNVTASKTADGANLGDVTVTASITGGSASTSFTWYTSGYSYIGVGATKANLSAGSYCVIARDSSGSPICKDTFCLTVTDTGTFNCAFFQASILETDGCGVNDILLGASLTGGGSNNYTIRWSTGSSFGLIANKSNGSYSVVISDVIFGCTDTAYITVVDDTCTGSPCDSFNANLTRTSDGANNNDVVLTVNVSGNSSNAYNTIWSNGESGVNNITVGIGTYCVDVFESSYPFCGKKVCYTNTIDTVSPCQNFQAWIYENDSCQKNDIALMAYPQDSLGTTRFKYLWNTGATSKSLTNKGSGSYWIKVTDSILGCVDTAYITVVDDTCNPCEGMRNILWSFDSCQSNDMTIYAVTAGGSGNYSYSWNTGSTAMFLGNRGTGWYKVTITDITNGCIYKDSIYAIDSNFKCCRAYFYTNDSAVASTKTFYGQNSAAGSTTYSWNFGDGNTGSGQTRNHTYTSSGNKTVCLYISTASGCKDTFCKVVNSPAPGKNLKVSHYGIPYIKDTNRYTYITYQNIGTTTENGIVEYKYPAGMTLISSTVSPLTHIGNKISFSVGSIAPGAGGTIYLVMKTPMSFTLGSMKCDTAIILPISGDIAPTNNTSYECDSVVASYDPNDKTPNPKGIGPDGNIPPTTSEIGYLIRFENEGNWRTYRVRVEDEIDPSFEINSVMIGDVSHAFRLVRTGSKLIWYFDDIELTPKSVNPDKSHGYIQYTLQLKPGLSLGTQLKNTAYIYFDANPAIITNTTKNTLKNADGSSAVRNLASGDLFDFNLKRDGDKLTIFSPSKMQALRIFDISGKLLLEKELHSDNQEIENLNLSQGIYIVHVDIDNQTVIRKIKF